MKLLFDQNLSRKLAVSLSDTYPGSTHVTAAGLDEADDRAIWEFAKTNDFTIVSKDSDFRQLSFVFGQPPKTVWLRIGNATTATAEQTLRDASASIDAFAADDEAALLVLESVR